VEGSGFVARALLHSKEVLTMAIRKPRLVEIDFIYITDVPSGGYQNRITVHASLHRSKLWLSFSIGGPAENRETLPAALVDDIKFGLDYAGKHVRVQDLVEIDPEPEVGEDP
jgi:hypothetical protein